jgi:amino acid adenylation domain-containing protein
VIFQLPHLLRRAAELRPDHQAVVDGDRSLTYRELDDRSDRLAVLLADRGVRRGDRVGLYLDKSVEAVVGLYAVMKSGAAYVPLDPAAPATRLGYIAGDCRIRVLLTSRAKARAWGALLEAGAKVSDFVLLDEGSEPLPEAPVGTTAVQAPSSTSGRPSTVPDDGTDDDLAYILYTSGSTGLPKGVMLTHRNALGFVQWAVEELGISGDDRLSSHAPFHFDLSILDLFAAASAAATLVLVPGEVSVFPAAVADFVEQQRITVWYSVPSVLSMLVQRGGVLSGRMTTLRLVLFAGEVFPTPYLRSLVQSMPHARFCNLYGPTETNVCTYHWVPSSLAPDDDRDIPIGRPIANVRAYVVDADLNPVPSGGAGELLISGCTVMRGYWEDIERTNRGLVPNPDGSGGLAYRTGDLVVEEAGEFRFNGRRDNQIKSRGYRIELGEIETVLHAHADVVECAAVAVPDPLITNTISAVVVTRRAVSASELARYCASRLPGYMVPSAFDLRDSLPRTSTGKIDRKGLAEEMRPPREGDG